MAIDNNNNKVLNVPALRFPEFSGEWRYSSLWNECDILCGYPFDGQDILEDSGSVKLLRGINITEGEIRHSKELDRYYSGDISRLEKYILKEGDLVLGMDGSKVGRNSAILTISEHGSYLVQRVCRIRSQKHNVEYIFHNINNSKFHRYVDSVKTASAIPHISQSDIQDYIIAFPPTTEEQIKITSLFSLLDQRIATQNKIIEKYESLIQAISQKVLRPSEYWNEYRLCELADIRSGYSGNQVSHKTAYAVTRIETISKHRIDMLRVGYVQDIPSEYKLNVGDILFSNINSIQYIGNTAFVDKEYNLYHGMNLLRIIPKPSLVIPRFLHLILCTSMAIKHFQSICNKAVSQASINQTSLGKIMLHIPPLTCQEQICNVFESVEQRLNLEVYYLKRIQLQKNYLLRQMFI